MSLFWAFCCDLGPFRVRRQRINLFRLGTDPFRAACLVASNPATFHWLLIPVRRISSPLPSISVKNTQLLASVPRSLIFVFLSVRLRPVDFCFPFRQDMQMSGSCSLTNSGRCKWPGDSGVGICISATYRPVFGRGPPGGDLGESLESTATACKR